MTDEYILTDFNLESIEIIELPMPNSGDYAYCEAEARKNEILEMQLSKKYFDFDNPYFGASIHIKENDQIEVYNSWTYQFGGGCENYSELVNSEDLLKYIKGLGAGNPEGVLITSEFAAKKSQSLNLILAHIFKPRIQIWYIQKK